MDFLSKPHIKISATQNRSCCPSIDRLLGAVAALSLLALTQNTQAQNAISWNYDNLGTVQGPTEFAGVVSVANWNNSTSSSSGVNLVNSSGATTTLGFSTVNAGSWSIINSHPGQDGNGTYNKEKLNGYADSHGSSSFTLTGIPYNNYYSMYICLPIPQAGMAPFPSVPPNMIFQPW